MERQRHEWNTHFLCLIEASRGSEKARVRVSPDQDICRTHLAESATSFPDSTSIARTQVKKSYARTLELSLVIISSVPFFFVLEGRFLMF